MKYLNQLENNKHSDQFLSINRKLVYLLESTYFFGEEPIIKSTPIKIHSDSNENGKKIVKYESDEVGIGGEWFFSYKDTHSRNEKPFEFFKVHGDAMLIDKKKILRFEETFENYKDAERLYNHLIKKYPESQIAMTKKLETPIKLYG